MRWALEQFERDLPVGAFDLEHPKSCVSAWHERAYGPVAPSRDARPGWEVLAEVCDADTTLITGAPLKNLGAALQRAGSDFRLGRWVAQGGFAGAGVVPPADQLPKFRGLETCPTYNLNGAPAAALAALRDPRIGPKRFVSKNVCHGVVYDADLHAQVAPRRDRRRSLRLIHQGMDVYLRKRPRGKAFHDPLAACCAIDPAIGVWAQVELYRAQGRWGARPRPGSDTEIIVRHDAERFREVLLA